MKKNPRFITFTGVDEKTDMDRCYDLSEKYPIEWGVLIGGNSTKNRYPCMEFVEEFSENDFRVSLHTCKHYADNAQEGILPEFKYNFNRIQINSLQYNLNSIKYWADKKDVNFIIQHRTEMFPEDIEGISYLQDLSGGRGKAPDFWAKPNHRDQLVGYAGGISFDNVEEVINNVPASEYWIDMESSLRTDDIFDLNICEAICKKVYGGNE